MTVIIAQAVRDAFRLTFEAVEQFPDRVNRWLWSRHLPYDVLGDQSVAICPTCNVEWPCDEFTRLDAVVTPDDDGSDACTVLLPNFIDMDVGPRCGKPAVKRLPEPLDFPVCVEHAEMFSPEHGKEES